MDGGTVRGYQRARVEIRGRKTNVKKMGEKGSTSENRCQDERNWKGNEEHFLFKSTDS